MSFGDYVDEFLADAQKEELRRKERNTIEHDKWDRGDFNSIASEMAMIGAKAKDLGQITGEAIAEHCTEDTFYALYKILVDNRDQRQIRPSHLVTQYVLDEARELPHYDQLRFSSEKDLVNSGLAFTELEPTLEKIFDKLRPQLEQAMQMEAMMEGMAEGAEDLQAMIDAMAEMAEGSPEQQDYQDRIASAREALEQMEQELKGMAEDVDHELDMNSVEVKEMLAQGIDEADEQVERLEAIESWGLEPGQLQRVPPQRRIELAKHLDNPRMREIAELIGPMTRIAFTEQERKTIYARNEIYDVIMGADLEHTLPSEFVGLDDDIMFLDFCRKLMEQSLLQNELKGVEKIDKGDIIVLEDGSGSMSGSKERWAKGFSGALMNICRRQGRGFTGIHFGSPGEFMEFDFDFKAGTVDTWLKEGGKKNAKTATYDMMEGIIHWMETFFSGGTDFMTPITVAVNRLEEQFAKNGQVDGDIVLITDGQCSVDEEWLQNVKERQKVLGFKFWGIIIGGNPKSEPLHTICDGRVLTVKDLTSGEELRRVFNDV